MDCCRSRVEGLHGGIARCIVRCYRDRVIYGWGLLTQGCEFLEIERGSLGAGSGKERKGGGARLNGSQHATTLSRGRVRVLRNP
ncbi:hypothetical protein CRG98_020407 [Punica granatum]|uniref:Uncharacterized protein n=1 Tax=Punica granatum TaxID=22663 RepID=A0A2I0JSE7_PUNGR|nr:hypothetical protein CRG98_020407 [Punica granatum]